MRHPKIGTQVYCVHNSYVEKKLKNGKILVGKVRSYENIKGTIQPIIKEVGYSRMISTETHNVYYDLEKAIEAISTDSAFSNYPL